MMFILPGLHVWKLMFVSLIVICVTTQYRGCENGILSARNKDEISRFFIRKKSPD